MSSRSRGRYRSPWLLSMALTVGLVEMLWLSFAGAVPVSASCNPGRGNGSPGVQQEAYAYRNVGYTTGGVYTTMYVYPHPYVYPLAGDTTLEAVELRQYNPTYYAQAGWIEGYSTGQVPHPFVAWTSPSGPALLVNNITLSWGQTGTVRVLFDYPATGAFNFEAFGTYYPGQTLGTVLGFTPTDGRVEGGTENIGSQMPGGYVSSSNAYFTGTHIYYSGGWNSFGGSGGQTLSYYTGAVTSSTREVVYDNSCPY